MQNVIHNKKYGIIFGVIVFFAILIAAICLPHTAMAADSDFAESPYLYLKYEKNGVECDGNELEANETYDVSFVLEGVTKLSVVQVTASVALDAQDNPLVTVASAPVAGSLLSETNSNMTSMGYVLDGNNIVFGFVSNESSYSAVSSSGVVLATVQMTFTDDCDAEDVITISDNPNMTFVQSVYAANNNYDDSYALVDTYENYSGTLYPMTADVSPVLGRDVSGSLVKVIASDGTTGAAAYGEYTIDVYADDQLSEPVTQTTSVYSAQDGTNTFTISGLKSGVYYAAISYDYAVTRVITITVSDSDISGSVVPVLTCDFDSDGSIGTNDAIVSLKSTGNDAYMDMDSDGSVGTADAILVLKLGGTDYSKLASADIE